MRGYTKLHHYWIQLADGLRSGGLLQSMQVYPQLFAPLFINTGELTVDDVLQALYVEVETELQSAEIIAIGFLQRFVRESDTKRMLQ